VCEIRVATVRVFKTPEYIYLSPQLIVRGKDLNYPLRSDGCYLINGWTNVLNFIKRFNPSSKRRHLQIICRLAELKKHMTSREMLSHPEASSLLLELVELNRRSNETTLLERLIQSEMLQLARSMGHDFIKE